MPTNFSGQLYQYDSVPVNSGIPFLTPWRQDTSGSTLQEYGKIYWVGKGGNDSNDGSDWEKRKLTIQSAITASNADIDDAWGVSPWAPSNVIVVTPGAYAENITSLPHGSTIYGLGNGGWGGDEEMGVKIKPASGIPVAGTWVNGAMYNITMESPDTSVVFDGATVNKVAFEKCRFAGLPGASPTTTDGFVSTGSSNVRFTNCQFLDLVDGLEFEGACVGVLIEDCIIEASTVGIHLTNGQLASYSHFRNCHITSSGNTILATGIEANNCNPKMHSMFITATDPISGTAKCEMCYGNGSLLTGAGA